VKPAQVASARGLVRARSVKSSSGTVNLIVSTTGK